MDSDMQRLDRVTPNPGTITFGHHTLTRKPELAALALATINIWSQIDGQTSSLFAYSIGTQQLFAIKVLQTLESASARNAQIRVAIKESLGEKALNLYAWIIKSGTASLGARNDFSHWLWGECDGLPNALLLLDPRYLAEHTAGVFDDLTRNLDAAIGLGSNQNSKTPVRNWETNRIFVYRKSDFERLIGESHRVHQALRVFQSMFPALGGTSYATIYKSLIDQHLIQPMP